MKKFLMLFLAAGFLIGSLAGCGSGGSGGGLASGVASDTTSYPVPTPTSEVNSFPVANAGLDQTVHVGETASLDGSGSYDLDGDLLSFRWTIQSKPDGSVAALIDAETPFPSITLDKEGDYVIQLTVTDSEGNTSSPDYVKVSTVNTVPVADAGVDQSVTLIGTLVTLGGQSYDLDGDPIAYSWTLKTKPAGSSASLSDPFSSSPTFVPDVYGDYEIELIVSDPWGSSVPDLVRVSFANLKPVANVGFMPAVAVGTSVTLNGSGSFDPNGDPLTFHWNVVYRPGGSTAALSDPLVANPAFVPDVAGTYVLNLVVNDGVLNSDPSPVTVMAVTTTDGTRLKLLQAIAAIQALDASAFRNINLRKALVNKINAVILAIDQGLYSEALNKVKHDILKKMDGCSRSGVPDKTDWIITCPAQNQVYPLLAEAAQDLEK